jgi:hypothetical protein
MKASGVEVLTVLIAFAAMLSAWILVGFAMQTYQRGPIPEKRLTSESLGRSDALSALRNAGGAISVTVDAGGKPLHNLFVSTVILKNTGQAPILPTDIFGKITLKTTAPWQIITVTNGLQGGIAFDWRKMSDLAFQAEPALINPGDVIWATVYLTNQNDADVTQDDTLSPPLEWDARISNLKAILTEPQNDPGSLASGQLVVFITSGGILIIVLSFIVYYGLYLHLFYLNGFLSPWRTLSFCLVLSAGLVSLSAAEAGNTYIVGPTPYIPQIDHLLNIPVLFFNLVALGTLFWMWRRKSRSGAGKPITNT